MKFFTRVDQTNIFIILSFLLPFLLFLLTLAPTITFGDSGELVTAAYTLGLSHPPGFSLWMILTKLVTFIPVNSIAWRANFASALYGSFALAALFYLIIKTARPLIKTKSSLFMYISTLSAVSILAVSRPFWSQSIVAEVYTLTVLLFVLQLAFLWNFTSSGKPTYLYWFSFILGLGIANHYVILAVYPAYLIFILLARPTIWKQTGLITRSLVCFLAGLSILLYVPIRAFTGAEMNWGHIDSWNEVLDYLRRKQFAAGTYKYSDANIGVYVPVGDFDSFSSVIQKIIKTPVYSAKILSHVFTPLLVLVSVIGLGVGVKHESKKSWRSSFLLLTALCLFFAEYLFNVFTTPSDFFIGRSSLFYDRLIPHSILIIWIAYAFIWISKRAAKKSPHAAVSLSLLFFALPLYFGLTRFDEFNWRSNTVAYDHGQNILNTLPEGAIIFIDKNDWLFPLLYLHTVEKLRPDVTLYDRTGNLFENSYRLSETLVRSPQELEQHRTAVEQKIIANNQNRPIYYAADKNFEQYKHDVAQEGILYRHESTAARHLDFYETYPSLMSLTSLPWHDEDTAYIVSYYHMRSADQLLGEEKRVEAVAELEKALSLAPDTYLTLNQLGTYFGLLEEYARAESMYRKALTIRPSSEISQNNLGTVLALQNKTDEAITVFERAIILNPESIQAHRKFKLESEHP